MQCSLSLLVPATLLAASAALAQPGGHYNVGTPRARKKSRVLTLSLARRERNCLPGTEPPRKVRRSLQKSARSATGRMGKEGQSSVWYWAVPATLIAAHLRIRKSPPRATIHIRRSRGIISTAQCPPINRDRSPRTKCMPWSRFCFIGTASSRRTTSWTPRLCRRSKCRTGMVSFRQSRCGRPIPRNPVGTERVAVAVIGRARV